MHTALSRLKEPCEGQEDCGHSQRRQDRVAGVAVVLGAVTVGDHDVLGARPGVALTGFSLCLLQPAAAPHGSHLIVDSLDDLPAVDGFSVQVVLLQLVTVDGVQSTRVEVGLSAAGVERAVTCPAAEAQTFPDEQAEQGQEGSGAEEELVHGSSGC